MERRNSGAEKVRKPARKRRQFTPEFKAGAVRLVIVEGRSISQVAKDLDLASSALGSWVAQARAGAGAGSPGSLTSADREELIRLRRENRQLRMERDILKKTGAYFAKDSL